MVINAIFLKLTYPENDTTRDDVSQLCLRSQVIALNFPLIFGIYR